jgi:threonine/homoserine/homoserine lactone efflux protein
VFPQFIRPAAGNLAGQALAMGAIIAATQALVYGAVALGASGVRAHLQRSITSQARVARAVALLLLGTSAWAVATGWAA